MNQEDGLGPSEIAVAATRNAQASTTRRERWRRQLPAADAAIMKDLSYAVASARRGEVDDARSTAAAQAARLVVRGYTYAAISRAAEVTPQTIASWAARVTPASLKGVVEDRPHDETLTVGVSPTERNPVPIEDADRLIELQLRVLDNARDSGARDALNLLCAQLRRRGYTLQAVADVLDVSREMVRQRAERVPEASLVGLQPDESTRAPEPAPLMERPRVRLTDEEVTRAKELMPIAARRRAPTPPESETGRAFTEFMDILFAGEDRGATAYTMAQQLGVTTAAVRHRMDRIRGTLPPSMQPAVPDGTLPRDPLEGLQGQILQLKSLLADSEIAKGRGPSDVRRLEASRRFDEQLADLVTAHRVPLRSIAAALGRSRSALAMRIASYQRESIGDIDDVESDDDELKARDSEVEAVEMAEERTGVHPGNPVVLPSRPGRLGDFSPETTPTPADVAPAPALVDPLAQHASTVRHMTLMRELREAVRAGGHATAVWDVGQDVSFTCATTLVNVEVKSISAGPEQYRLGVGQLAEQVQHHLDHLTAGTAWYVASGISSVSGVLVVTDEIVPAVWRRLAERWGLAVWSAEKALDVFSNPQASELLVGVGAPINPE